MSNTKSPIRDGSVDTGIVRLNVNLNAETAAALRKIAEEREISFTEAVRRAISIFSFIDEESRAGRHVQTTDSERGNVRELIWM
jgi:hypothetical protein